MQFKCKLGRVGEKGVFGQVTEGVELLTFLVSQSTELVKNGGAKMLNLGWVRLNCCSDEIVCHGRRGRGLSFLASSVHFIFDHDAGSFCRCLGHGGSQNVVVIIVFVVIIIIIIVVVVYSQHQNNCRNPNK